MHRVGPDDAVGRERQVYGDDDAGSVLPPAQPAVAAHQALECGDLLGTRIDEAVDVDVGRLGAVGDALDELRGVRTERRERVLTLDVTVVEPVGAVVSQRDRSVLVHHHDEADTGVQRQAIDQAGKAPVQLRAVQTCLLTAHVDQPQVAGPEDVKGLLARRVPVGRAG